jgi:hypothetical protein
MPNDDDDDDGTKDMMLARRLLELAGSELGIKF